MKRAMVMAAAGAAALAAGAAGATPPVTALSQLKAGLWKLELDEGPARTLCVEDPFALVQLEERAAPGCSRLVISAEGDAATVSYDCPTAGWGRTSIRVVTASFVRLDTQGVARNAPYAFAAVGRRVGDCRAAPQRR